MTETDTLNQYQLSICEFVTNFVAPTFDEFFYKDFFKLMNLFDKLGSQVKCT